VLQWLAQPRDQARPLPQQSRVLQGPPVKLSDGLARTKAEPTSMLTAPQTTYPVSSIRVHKPRMKTQWRQSTSTIRRNCIDLTESRFCPSHSTGFVQAVVNRSDQAHELCKGTPCLRGEVSPEMLLVAVQEFAIEIHQTVAATQKLDGL